MKKILTVLLAALLLGLCFAMAEESFPEAAAFTPTGIWYAEMDGFVLELSLEEGGTYSLTVLGGEGTQGAWELKNGAVILDGEEAAPLTLIGQTLRSGDGRLAFSRQQPETYQPAPVTEVQFVEYEGIQAPLDFTGAWKSAYVLNGGTAIPAASLGDNTILYFEIPRVMILGDVFGELVADFTFEDNALRLDEEGISFEIRKQEDGYLRFTVTAGEEELIYIMEPYMTEEFPLGEESDEPVDFPMPDDAE